MPSITPIAASFKDHNGFIFKENNLFYRLIKPSYFNDYEWFLKSGLYEQLISANRLLPHQEVPSTDFEYGSDCKILLPTQLPFITYPYEWSFGMWQDAAIVTLKIALQALQKDMILKDATAFNIQFYNGRPVFIDTLSFTKYEIGSSWIAYHQFCECFLVPLLLMHYTHADMGKLFMIYPNGIPLTLAKSLLPPKVKFNLQVYLHIWLQAKMASSIKDSPSVVKKMPKHKLELLLKGLLNMVTNLTSKKSTTTWEAYYSQTILGNQYLNDKVQIFKKFTTSLSFNTVIDLGANDGYFSLLLKDSAKHIVAIDYDTNCVNELYKNIRLQKIKNIVPLLSTLNTPTPSIGWCNEERQSLIQRLSADVVLALALIHHLAIAENIPLPHIAKWLSNMGTFLIIEFVPKTDEKVQQLLQYREDIFIDYTLDYFENIFSKFYEIVNREKIGNTDRMLFLMKKLA